MAVDIRIKKKEKGKRGKLKVGKLSTKDQATIALCFFLVGGQAL